MAYIKAQTQLDEMYGRVARRYDLLNTLMTFGLDRRVRRKASIHVRSGRIIDVGTGTGISARELRRAYPGSFIVGVDRSPEMLEIAVRDGAAHFVRGGVRSLPFSDEAFDSAVAGFIFRPLEGDRQAISEIYRVLRPGGRAVIYDTLGVPAGVFGFFYKLALVLYVRLCAFILADDTAAYLYFTRSIRESVTADELAGRLRAAGFSAVGVKQMMFGTITILTADKPEDA
jgi:demethylmenaquinone methyltransferase/2-methoxy-6-polyprenyl-1,4-benzoquinol methylase